MYTIVLKPFPAIGVNDLNPEQGIETGACLDKRTVDQGVNDLNPEQEGSTSPDWLRKKEGRGRQKA